MQRQAESELVVLLPILIEMWSEELVYRDENTSANVI
jgi:hypothetical protein